MVPKIVVKKGRYKMKKANTLPLDIQFFAEGEAGAAEPQESAAKQEEEKQPDSPKPEAKQDDGGEKEPKKELTVEEQLAKLQKELANEHAKTKMLEKKLDKTKESEEKYRTRYNESLTEAQKAEQEKLEREAKRNEEFEQLKRESAINKRLKHYLKRGFPEDKAEEMATAYVDGDESTQDRIELEMDDFKKKLLEAEFIKSNPQIVTGAGDGQEEKDPFIEGFKSATSKRV